MADTRPGEVSVIEDRSALNPSFEIFIRRGDGSLYYAAKVMDSTTADACVERIKEAITNEEPWILKVMDVSAGELRAS